MRARENSLVFAPCRAVAMIVRCGLILYVPKSYPQNTFHHYDRERIPLSSR